MSGRRWDGGGGRGIESEEEEAGVGLMSGVHVAVHGEEEEEESSFGGRGGSAAACDRGGCPGPSTSSVGCTNNHRPSGAKHVLVWNQPELDDLTAADNHNNGYSHRPVPTKGIHLTRTSFVAIVVTLFF